MCCIQRRVGEIGGGWCVIMNVTFSWFKNSSSPKPSTRSSLYLWPPPSSLYPLDHLIFFLFLTLTHPPLGGWVLKGEGEGEGWEGIHSFCFVLKYSLLYFFINTGISDNLTFLLFFLLLLLPTDMLVLSFSFLFLLSSPQIKPSPSPLSLLTLYISLFPSPLLPLPSPLSLSSLPSPLFLSYLDLERRCLQSEPGSARAYGRCDAASLLSRWLFMKRIIIDIYKR